MIEEMFIKTYLALEQKKTAHKCAKIENESEINSYQFAIDNCFHFPVLIN